MQAEPIYGVVCVSIESPQQFPEARRRAAALHAHSSQSRAITTTLESGSPKLCGVEARMFSAFPGPIEIMRRSSSNHQALCWIDSRESTHHGLFTYYELLGLWVHLSLGYTFIP